MTQEADYSAAMATLRSWIGTPVRLVQTGGIEETYEGVLAVDDRASTADLTVFTVPRDPPLPGRLNPTGTTVFVYRAGFRGQWAGPALIIWQGVVKLTVEPLR